MPELIIYGASDDLLEIDGHIVDEFYLGDGDMATVAVFDPATGDDLRVTASFGGQHGNLDWALSVEVLDTFPAWPLHFGISPEDRGNNDPAVYIEVPETVEIRLIHGEQ